MNIAIDFDNTLTADATLWVGFVELARKNGHRCYCVTARRDTDENRETVSEWLADNLIALPVFYTSLAPKTGHMESLGIKIDIWIDDDPRTLVNGH